MVRTPELRAGEAGGTGEAAKTGEATKTGEAAKIAGTGPTRSISSDCGERESDALALFVNQVVLPELPVLFQFPLPAFTDPLFVPSVLYLQPQPIGSRKGIKV